MMENLQNFACGCFSGWVQVFVMQPFEIVKVRLQTQSWFNPEYSGTIDCIKKILKQQGALAFYKGTLAPLLGVGWQVSLQFGSNQLSKKTMQQFHNNNEQPLPMKLVILSGMLTGIPSSISVTPIDHMRILMQIQHGKMHKYNGSIQAGFKIYKKHGFKGLYLGFPITLYRQIIAMATYFGFYEWGMRKLAPQGQSSAGAPLEAAFFIGGIAGMLSWLTTYPLDLTKTIIQSQDLDSRKYKTTLDCIKDHYKSGGVNSFYRGLSITMIRSFPVNASGFYAFEYAMRKLKKQE